MGLHKQASLKHKMKQSRETSDKKKKKKIARQIMTPADFSIFFPVIYAKFLRNVNTSSACCDRELKHRIRQATSGNRRFNVFLYRRNALCKFWFVQLKQDSLIGERYQLQSAPNGNCICLLSSQCPTDIKKTQCCKVCVPCHTLLGEIYREKA